MEKLFSNISTKPYLNYNHPLFTKPSLSLDEINLILEQKEELKDINLIYKKLITSNSDINSEEIEKVTIWARKIFEHFEKENFSYYNKINTVDQQLKSLIGNNDINRKKDAIFSLQLYINYLTNCYILNSEEQKNPLAEKFNAVFSLDLEVCPGGIGSAFINAMSSGIFQKILENNVRKYIDFIPENLESHFRQFLTNLINHKTSDEHQDSIEHYLSRNELRELFTSLAKGDVFESITKDTKDIHNQLIESNLLLNPSINNYSINILNLLTQDHYLFTKKILNYYYFFNEMDGNFIFDKKEVIQKVKGQFINKALFVDSNQIEKNYKELQQIIEFTSWLIEKVNSLDTTDSRREKLVKLVESTVLFGFELLEIEDKSQSFCDYFIKINNVIPTNKLAALLDVRNDRNETVLHILAHNPKNLIRVLEAADKLSPDQFFDLFKIQRTDDQTLLHIFINKSPKELPKVLETINTKIEGHQFLSLLLIEDKKYKLPILHILAIQDSEIFLKTLEIAQEKLNYEEFAKLLGFKAINEATILDILPIKNRVAVTHTIKIIDKKLGSDDLNSLLLTGDKTTALHNLARIDEPKYFINTLEILTNKLNPKQLIALLEAEEDVIFKQTPLHIISSINSQEFEDVIKIIEKKLNSDEIEKLITKEISHKNFKLTVLDLLKFSINNSQPSNNIIPNNAYNVKNQNNDHLLN